MNEFIASLTCKDLVSAIEKKDGEETQIFVGKFNGGRLFANVILALIGAGGAALFDKVILPKTRG